MRVNNTFDQGVLTNSISVNTKNRIIDLDDENYDIKLDDPISLTISEEGFKSYKNSIDEKNAASKGVIISNYGYMLSSKLPSIYGEKDVSGEYECTYRNITEKVNDLLKAYASIYDEIIQGHENGTREIYIKDKNSDQGYRKLSMDEEIGELNKAFEKKAKKMEEREKKNKRDLEIINADYKVIRKTTDKKTRLAKEALKEEEAKKIVLDNLSNKIINAGKIFAKQYLQGGKNHDIAKIIAGIKVL